MKRLFKPLEDIGDDSIIHIINREQDRLETICDYGYEDLVPITAADWWQFAPWQDMETAPLFTPLLLKGNGIIQNSVYGINESDDLYIYATDETIDVTKSECEGWLPLPTVQS